MRLAVLRLENDIVWVSNTNAALVTKLVSHLRSMEEIADNYGSDLQEWRNRSNAFNDRINEHQQFLVYTLNKLRVAHLS